MLRSDFNLSKNSSTFKYVWQFIKQYPRHLTIILTATIFSIIMILSIGQILKYIIDNNYVTQFQYIFNPMYLFLLITLTIAISSYFRISNTVILAEKVSSNIRIDRLKALLKCNYYQFENQSVGDLQSRLSTDINEVRNFLSNQAAIGLRNIIQLSGSLIFLFIASPLLSCCILASVPLIFIPLKILGRRSRDSGTSVQNCEGKINGVLEELISGIIIIKSFNAEKNFITRVSNMLANKLTLNYDKAHLRALNVAIIIFMALSSIIIVLNIGIAQVSHHSMTAGSLTSFIFYAILLINSINNFTDIFAQANTISGAISRIQTIDDYTTESLDIESPRLSIKSKNASVEFKDVSFSYNNDSDNLVLDAVSFSIKAGEKVAIVGFSGAGKSTLLKLLMGLYNPQKGQILINNTYCSDMGLKMQRAYFSYVPQDVTLFDESIADNITFLNPYFSLQSIVTAATKSLVSDFADKFSLKYDTQIGPKGSRLSGGQRQRISLARALIYDSPIILLDEATNSLDNISESIIQRTLLSAVDEKTVIIIAHRLSTIKNVDRIFMMHNKEIIGQGTHAELLVKCAPYHNLFTAEHQMRTDEKP